MKKINLGTSDLQVTPICLGTMTFGEQVAEKEAHSILDRSLELGVNFLDTAEMYSVPAKAETFGATERILGNWFANNPGARQKVVLATKVAGPSRGMPWVREGAGLTSQDILKSCDASQSRLFASASDWHRKISIYLAMSGQRLRAPRAFRVKDRQLWWPAPLFGARQGGWQTNFPK